MKQPPANLSAGSSENIPMIQHERFPALTGIKAVAAFMVFFHHLPLRVKPGFLMGVVLVRDHFYFI